MKLEDIIGQDFGDKEQPKMKVKNKNKHKHNKEEPVKSILSMQRIHKENTTE